MPPRRTWIERMSAADFARRLDELKAMRAAGWDLTFLHDERRGEVIVFGWFDAFGNVRAGVGGV